MSTAAFAGTPAQARENPEPAAAANPFTAAEACANDHGGAWAHVSDGHREIKEDGVVYGEVYLMYDYDTGENCVVTLKRRAVGKKTRTGALLTVQGRGSSTDDDDYKYYASVAAPARDTCVRYIGGMTNGGKWRNAGRTEWGNCS